MQIDMEPKQSDRNANKEIGLWTACFVAAGTVAFGYWLSPGAIGPQPGLAVQIFAGAAAFVISVCGLLTASRLSPAVDSLPKSAKDVGRILGWIAAQGMWVFSMQWKAYLLPHSFHADRMAVALPLLFVGMFGFVMLSAFLRQRSREHEVITRLGLS